MCRSANIFPVFHPNNAFSTRQESFREDAVRKCFTAEQSEITPEIRLEKARRTGLLGFTRDCEYATLLFSKRNLRQFLEKSGRGFFN